MLCQAGLPGSRLQHLGYGFGAMQRQCRAEPSLAKSLEGVWQGLNEGECKLS